MLTMKIERVFLYTTRADVRQEIDQAFGGKADIAPAAAALLSSKQTTRPNFLDRTFVVFHSRRCLPGVANVNENLSSVSSAFERNAWVCEATVCGISS